MDDEYAFRATVRCCLEKNGFRVLEASDGADALAVALECRPAIILLDLRMTRWDGWRTLAELRRRRLTTPVVMLTSVADERSLVLALDSGADDYLAKPCSAPQLMARIRALLRRCPPPACVGHVRLGDIEIEFAEKSAARSGHPVALTRKEFDLLQLLAAGRGCPVSRAAILGRVWGIADESNSHTLDTHLWRLRSKLGQQPDGTDWIRNVPGTGYVLDGVVDDDREHKNSSAA